MSQTFKVEDMSCAHCEKRISDKLTALGVEGTIDLPNKELTLADGTDIEKVKAELEAIGYPLK